jgi:4-hydroxy-tetrahydrodipicolinate synthase
VSSPGSIDVVDALRTVIAIPVTPFDQSGDVDQAAYGRVVDSMLDAGISVLTPNGNTGEFYSLTIDETRSLLTATVEHVAGRGLVLAGVGHDVSTAARMAADAATAGAAAVMVHQPVHPYKSAEGWVAYHRAIADAAPALGVVAYVRDPHITAADLAALADACPTLVGIKYAIADPIGLSAAIQTVGPDRVAWVCGLAEKWAPFHWEAGVRGFTSGLVNVAPALALRLLDLLRAEAMADAMALWRRLLPMEDLRARRFDANNVSALKEALAQLGVCGRAVRPPISPLPAGERVEVTAILRDWNLSTG